MAHDKSDSSFRVIDRRLFTEEGELRPEAQEQVQREKEAPAAEAAKNAASPSAAPAGKTAAPAAPAEEKPVPARSPYFDLLVRSLANQAAMLLTGIQDPATGQTMVDIEGAREVIDMLDALREKTRGNLAPEEDKMLAEMLGSLKFSYLEMSKAAAAAAAEQGAGRGSASRR
ncbi:MAG TPA: DUF1844 domain-containing protein [Candidatus Solibacter sp.]|nr:DUF1844 domain-containing protein [Candidatus Solibacter sp.]